jgi:hypothetical protein
MRTISSSIRRTQTPDGAVLLDVERGQMLCLNPVGSKILALIAAGSEEEEIAERVSAEYGVDRHIVRADVSEFLETLRQHGVIRGRDQALGRGD